MLANSTFCFSVDGRGGNELARIWKVTLSKIRSVSNWVSFDNVSKRPTDTCLMTDSSCALIFKQKFQRSSYSGPHFVNRPIVGDL
jgi:hypothetical protein